MRTSKNDSYFDSDLYKNLKRLRRGDNDALQVEKENQPWNIQKNTGYSASTSKAGSPMIEKHNTRKNASPLGSPGGGNNNLSLNQSNTCVMTDRRQRSVTPKSLKELLAEQKKRVLLKPSSPGEAVKQNYAMKLSEMLGLSRTPKSSATSIQIGKVLAERNDLSSPKLKVWPGDQTESKPIMRAENKWSSSTLTQMKHSQAMKPQEPWMCSFHKEKKAKYRIGEEGLCSKCAVTMANEGHKVQEIDQGDQESTIIYPKEQPQLTAQDLSTIINDVTADENDLKVNEFKMFIDRVKALDRLTQFALQDNQTKQQRLKDHYGRFSKELLELERLASDLMTALKQNAKSLRAWAESESSKEFIKFRQAENEILSRQHDLELFTQNLGENFEETINMIDLPHLKERIQRFDSQLRGAAEVSRKGLESRITAICLLRTEPSLSRDLELGVRTLFRASHEMLGQATSFTDYQLADIKQISADLNMPEIMTAIKPPSGGLPQVHMSFEAVSGGRFNSLIAPCTSGSTNKMNDSINLYSMQKQTTSLHAIPSLPGRLSSRLEQIVESTQEKSSAQDSFSHIIPETEHENEMFGLTLSGQGNFENFFNPSDPLFILSPTEADFVSKQTPELGPNKLCCKISSKKGNRCQKILFQSDEDFAEQEFDPVFDDSLLKNEA